MSIYFVSPSTATKNNHSSPAQYTIHQIDGHTTSDLKYLVAMPEEPDPRLAPLVLIHGILRDAKGMLAEVSKRLLTHAGRVIIAPVFDKRKWHGYQRVIDKCRADLALLSLFETIKLNNIPEIRKFELLGYSGGAQFSHRFALLYPHLVQRLVLCSAGWYTFPDNSGYPYGLSVPDSRMPGFTVFTRKNLAGFLQIPIEVYVGEKDTEIDKYTRTGSRINKQQGFNRVQRARNWVDAMKSAAHELDIRSRVKLKVLKDCGHDFRECLSRGKLIENAFLNQTLLLN